MQRFIKIKHNEGVANVPADPTAWEQTVVEVSNPFTGNALAKMVMTDCFGSLTGRVYRKGRERLFISECINRRLWPLVDWLYRRINKPRWEAMHAEMYAHFDDLDGPDFFDNVREGGHLPDHLDFDELPL